MRQHAWNKSEACYFNDLQSPKLSCHRGENSAQRDGLLALPGTVRKAEIQEESLLWLLWDLYYEKPADA